MSNDRGSLGNREGHLRNRFRVFKGLIAVGVLLFAAPFATAQLAQTGLYFGTGTGTEVQAEGSATFKGIDGEYVLGANVSVTGTAGFSTAGVATNDATGDFSAGNSVTTIAVDGTADEWDELLGFVYLQNDDAIKVFSGNIDFSGVEISVIATGDNVGAYGAFFRNAFGSTAHYTDIELAAGNAIKFGTLNVTSADSTAVGFVAGNLLAGTVTIANIDVTGNLSAAGVELYGSIATGATLEVTGLVEVSNDGSEGAYGFKIWEDLSGTLKARDIEVTTVGGGDAFGILVGDEIEGGMMDGGKIIVGGNIDVTGDGFRAVGIGVMDGIVDSEINVTGNIDIVGAVQAVGIGVVSGGIDESTIAVTGNIDVVGALFAAGIAVENGGIVGSEITIDGKIDALATGNAFGFFVEDGISNSTIIIDNIEATSTGSEAYGFAVAGSIAGSSITITEGIKAISDSTFGAGGFVVWSGAHTTTSTNNTTSINIGGIHVEAENGWAVGAHATGTVSGTLFSTGDITVIAGTEAHGLRVEGNLTATTTRVGEIDVKTTSATHAAFGIRVGDRNSDVLDLGYGTLTGGNVTNLILEGDITVTGGHGITSGIWTAGNTNIKLGDDVTIETNHAAGAAWAGADISTYGNLTIDLAGKTLETSKVMLNTTGTTLTVTDTSTGASKGTADLGDLRLAGSLAVSGGAALKADSVEAGGNVTVTGGSAVLGSLSMIGNFTVSGTGSAVTVTNSTGSNFGTLTTVEQGTSLTLSNGGTIGVLGGGGAVHSTGNLVVSNTVADGFSGTINSGGNLELNAGKFNIAIGETPGIVATGNITLGSGTILNITGYTVPEDPSLPASNSVVKADGTVSGFNPVNVTVVAGLPPGGFLTVVAELINNSEIKLQAKVNWDDSGPNTFSIGEGEGFTFGGDLGTYGIGGSLVKADAGTLILTGTNTYTGGTIVNAGTLQLGNGGSTGSVAGNITNNANVTFNYGSGATVTYAGNITGTGTITKNGAGTLILNGNDNEGNTTVNAGTLLVGGANNTVGKAAELTGNVTVGNGATLGGHGTIIGSITIGNNGTLAPGGSIGILTVQPGSGGSVTFQSGSTYLVDINATTATPVAGIGHDQLVVGAGGTVDIQAGAKLFINFTGSEAGEARIISTPQTSGGMFALSQFGVKFNENGFRSDGGYWVAYEFVSEFADAVRGFATPNAYNVAEGIDGIIVGGQIGSISGLFNALSPIDDPQTLANAFTQLHGEVFAANKIAAAQQQRRFQQLMPNGREYYSNSPVWNRWGTFTGDWQNRAKIKQYSGYDLWTAGIAFGVDRTITQKVLIGGAIGYDYSHQDFKSLQSIGQFDSLRTMLYGSWYNGAYYVDAYGGYTKNFHKTKRDIDFGGFNATSRSSYNDDMGSVGLEFGRVWQVGGFSLTPNIGLHYTYLYTPDVTENDGRDANLFVQSDEHHSVRLPIGIKASRIFAGSHGIAWMPELRAVYSAELGDDSAKVRTSFVNVPSVEFGADSGRWGRHSGRMGAGIGALVSNKFSLRLDYDYEIYNHTNVNSLSATLGVQW